MANDFMRLEDWVDKLWKTNRFHAHPCERPHESWLNSRNGEVRDLCSAYTQNRPQHLIGMQGSKVMHQSHAGTLAPEEPDELIAHVRVCGGAGWVTTGSTRKPTAPMVACTHAAVSTWRGGSPRALGCCAQRCLLACPRAKPDQARLPQATCPIAPWVALQHQRILGPTVGQAPWSGCAAAHTDRSSPMGWRVRRGHHQACGAVVGI